jgi:predicted ATPase
LLLARLDHLGAAKEVAQWAAVMGREFSTDVLQAVTQFDPKRLQVDLLTLISAGLIYAGAQQQASRDNAIFRHALIQETAYASLPRRVRQNCHRRIAEVIVQSFPQIAETQPELLAQHHAQAGMPIQAADRWTQAGQRARSQGAAREALTFYESALALIDPADRERRWLALEGREQALDWLGQRAEQKADLDALLELAEALGNDTRRSEAYMRHVEFAGVQGDYKAALTFAEPAIAAAQQALKPTLELRARAYKAQTLIFMGDLVIARQAVDEMLARLPLTGKDSVRALVLTVAAQYYMATGDLVRTVQLQIESADIAGRTGSYSLQLSIQANLGLVYATLGLCAQARATLEATVERAEALGERRLHASSLLHLGAVYWWCEDLDLARRTQEQALAELVLIRESYGEACCHAYLGGILEAAGELALAADHLAQACDSFARIGADPDQIEAKAIATHVALAQGRRQEALQWALEVWGYLREHGAQGLTTPSRTYLCVADVLEAVAPNGPAGSAREVIDAGYSELMRRADAISDAEWRRSFLENVAENWTMVERGAPGRFV